MSILITGGAGTLAGDFLDYWQENAIDEELILLDNLSQSVVESTEISAANIRLLRIDCTETQTVVELFAKYQPRAVLHFASTMDSSDFGFNSNIQTLLATLIAAEKTSRPIIFFPQSFLSRNCSESIADESLIEPELGEYPLFKSLCEIYLRAYSGKSVAGIISTTLSPRLSIGPIPAFIKRLLGGQAISISDTSRDYISPSAVVTAILLTLEESFEEETVVIASGTSKATKDIYHSVSAQLNISRDPEPGVTPPGPGDPREILLVPSKKLIDVGWNPLMNLDSALINCINAVKTSTTSIRQHHIK